MKNKFLSICIPSYNRPQELKRLLLSIDASDKTGLEIVICEDNSPRREEIRRVVEEYIEKNIYDVMYFENSKNYGYDGNLRQCIKNASGEWIMFMGDDDMFVPEVLDRYMLFLKENLQLGYVMRSYQTLHADGSIEFFKYYDQTKYFDPGFDTCAELFRRSLFISGFCFKRKYALADFTEDLDGTLLYQCYILTEICLKYPAAYYAEPIAQSVDGGIPYFGNSEVEKGIYTPGSITVENSIAFMEKYFVVTEYLDKKHSLQLTKRVALELSKYSYPILSIQREKGRQIFYGYHKKLCKIGLNITLYYYIYFVALYIFGENICDNIIQALKRILGKTPKL